MESKKKRPDYSDLPERIDASPEEIAQAAFSRPFEAEWRYLREADEEDEHDARETVRGTESG